MFSIHAQHGGEIRLHVSRQSVKEPQAACWHTKTGAPFSSNVSQPRWVTEPLALLETSTSALRFLAAGAEGIIRELVGIRGLSNPNLYIDSTIISLVFKSDYTLQLKEASAGSFMGTRNSEPRALWRVLGKRPRLWSAEQKSTNCPSGSSGMVESWAYAKHGWRCINMDCTQRDIFIYNMGKS